MAIQVPADLEASIRERIEAGRYQDEAEVIRAALRSLDARDEQVERLRVSIAEGLAAIERGEGHELTPELWDEIDREADERIRLGLLPHPDVCP